MLRTLVLLLIAANALFFAWSRGWMDGVAGLHAGPDREPQRLRQESHGERITLLNPQAASAMQRQACLVLSPLGGIDALRAAQAALEKLGVTAADWTVQADEQPATWGVATIKLGSHDFQLRKEETYKKMRIAFEPLPGLPDEQPSLLLSRHDSQQAAEAALESLSQRALKGLRVLQLQPSQLRYALQLQRADGPLQAQLQSSKDPAFAAGFQACSPGAASTAASGATGTSGAASTATAASAASAPAANTAGSASSR